MDNQLNIGLTFSGGGYRAATFDLGALSMLNSVRLDDGRTLLDCVTALTSVSGGTIPALKYMLTRARGHKVEDMVDELFAFLCNEDLLGHALRRLSDEKANPDASSIKIMAEIYDKYLFGGAVMGEIIDNFDRVPVKDYTALATDFDNSLPFRFRLTEGRLTDNSRVSYGVFGNQRHSIGRSVVRHITLGEALACSSCFPSGFEPMMFPDDFKVWSQEDIASGIKKRFGIMDGGVVDNQGIDPILLAEKRMRKYRQDKTRTDKAFDLIIVSDVASPYMDGYKPSGDLLPKNAGRLTIGRLRNYGLISLAVVMVLFIVAMVLGSDFWLGVMSVILAIVAGVNIIGALAKNKLFSTLAGTIVGNRATFISHLKFSTLAAMVMNRAKSVLMMSSEIFLKRLRQVNYDAIYEDEQWKDRVMSSTVYELRPGEQWKSLHKEGSRTAFLTPSEAIQQNSDLAASMGTTLWFTDEEKSQGMPQALLAAGQYTICYNLLKYILRIEENPVDLTAGHHTLIALKDQLLEAWNRFQQDPRWMVPQKG